MKSQKLVIFDLDNTLIVTHTAAKDAYKQAINYIAKQHGLYNNRYKLYNHWKKIVQSVKHEKDPLKREFEYSLRLLLNEQKIPDTYLPNALVVFEKEFLKKLAVQRGVKETLSWLKKAGHQIAVATESTKGAAKKKLKATSLMSMVDILVTANEVGNMKPDKRFYEIAIKEANVNQDDVIVVGDRDAEDLDPARDLGLKAILVPPEEFHLGKVKEQLVEIFQDEKV